MGLVPVSAHQVTSVVGLRPEIDDEFKVTRLSNHQGKTSDALAINEHQGNRAKLDERRGQTQIENTQQDRRFNDHRGDDR